MRRCLWTPVLLALALPVAAQERPPVVAVFNVDVQGVRLAPDVLDRLSSYLSVRLGEGARFQVVPRDQVKARLVEQKKASYKACFDQSCQIELGREMAAQKTLAAQVLKLGAQCRVTLSLYDLARSATDNTASAAGACTEEGIVAALDLAVGKLLGSVVGRRQAGRPGDAGGGSCPSRPG